jgi:hypothetical protein
MRAAYNALRDNAKRRHKEFTLTFSEFKEFCVKTNYMAGKGRQKLSYTIDRAKNWLGYTKDNIQCMTKSDNSSKGTRSFTLHYDWQTKYATVVHNTRDRGGGDFDLPK